MAIEKPVYTILKKDNDIELREYDGYIRASVTVQASSYNNAGNTAFSVLAEYIFGHNIDTTRIKMTVPVMTQAKNISKIIPMTAPVTIGLADAGSYEVSFIMPSEFTIRTIPEPINKLVKLHVVTTYRAAAITFTGYSDEKRIRAKTALLDRWLEKNKLVKKGDSLLARYDPPWKPGFLRKNEIIINVT